jgi:hypothetical protein
VRNQWTVCTSCRKGWRGSPTCGHDTKTMPRNWRIPPKRNTKAWDRLTRGDIWWELPPGHKPGPKWLWPEFKGINWPLTLLKRWDPKHR